MSTADRSDEAAMPGTDPRDDPRWEAVRATAAATVPTPPGLISRVLRSVRGARGTKHGEPVVLDEEGGRLQISEHALVMLARTRAVALAGEIGGVYVSAVALEGGGLEVLVAMRYGVAIDDAADTLRLRLTRALADQLGPRVPPVSVHAVDVRSS